MVETLNFDQNFKCDWKFLNFSKFPPSHVPSSQKCPLLAKFSTRLKISWFWPIHSLQVLSGQKSHFDPNLQHDFFKISGFCQISYPSHVLSSQKSQFWAKFSTQLKICGFSTRLKICGFCQISSFAGQALPPCQKSLFLSQIFNTALNFVISPNFILRRSRVVKTLNFEPNFQGLSKFLDCAKFHLS